MFGRNEEEAFTMQERQLSLFSYVIISPEAEISITIILFEIIW